MNQHELHIFPTRDKRPLTKNGLYDARLENTWTGKESDQWGAPCGKLNGFFVIDVDAQHSGLETAKDIDWGDTLIINTPSGGYHVYYKYDEEKMDAFKNGVSILPGIDLRVEGGYVVLYGEVDREKVAAIPPNIFSLLNNATKRSKAESIRSKNNPSATSEVMEGGRNAYLTKVAGRMQRLGVLTLAALQEKNETDCNPPLDESEVELIFNSIARYAPDSTPDEDDTPRPRIKWAGDLISGMFEFLNDKGKTQGESTGIPALDELIGGKRLGELTVMLATAKSGKNTLYHYQQRSMLDRGIAIGYASRELTPESEVLPNLLSLKLGKNIYTNLVTQEEVMNAISGWKLAFSNGYGSFQGDELWEWLDECRANGVQYFFIDHLHYCLADSEDFKNLAEFGRKLKTYTKTHQVHIDLIIQPKVRNSYKIGDKLVKQELGIEMLRGGASLGQVLDSLVTMDRLPDANGDLTNISRIDVKVARSKLARTGHFFLEYDRKDMSFRECDEPTASTAPKSTIASPKNNLPSNPTPGYANSKNGSFFDLKRSVDKMLTTINESKANE